MNLMKIHNVMNISFNVPDNMIIYHSGFYLRTFTDVPILYYYSLKLVGPKFFPKIK